MRGNGKRNVETVNFLGWGGEGVDNALSCGIYKVKVNLELKEATSKYITWSEIQVVFFPKNNACHFSIKFF